MKLLQLDQLWWLVSPQNPLKPVAGMAPLTARLAGAKAMARHPRIKPSDLETRLGTRFTIDTLAALQRRYPQHRFVWIMGADNLLQISRWARWRAIFARVPVAVFDRPAYVYKALASKAARRFAGHRVATWQAKALASKRPPAWCFIPAARHPASATALRARQRRSTKELTP